MRLRIRQHWPVLSACAFAMTGLLLVAALQTALPVIVDVRPSLAAVMAAAGALFAFHASRTTSRSSRGIAVAAGVAASAVALTAAYDWRLRDRTREMAIVNGDVELSGTLVLPDGDGPHPAMVLVHGSGPQPRKEYLFYARQYARRGIASLAYDKRGSGASTRSASVVPSYEVLASDAVAAMAWLRQQPDIDRERVGVWGLSEGEWVGAVAAKQGAAAFFVVVSPSAMTPAEQVAYEASARVRRAGFGVADADRARELYRAVSRFQRSGDGRAELNRQLEAASLEPWFRVADVFDASVPNYEDVQRLEWFPAWRSRMDFDPLPVLASLSCPVLALVGGRDPNSDGEHVVARMRAAMAAGGPGPFEGRVYPDAEHNLVEWRLPGRMPPPMFAEGVLDGQIEWVRQRVGLR